MRGLILLVRNHDYEFHRTIVRNRLIAFLNFQEGE